MSRVVRNCFYLCVVLTFLWVRATAGARDTAYVFNPVYPNSDYRQCINSFDDSQRRGFTVYHDAPYSGFPYHSVNLLVMRYNAFGNLSDTLQFSCWRYLPKAWFADLVNIQDSCYLFYSANDTTMRIVELHEHGSVRDVPISGSIDFTVDRERLTIGPGPFAWFDIRQMKLMSVDHWTWLANIGQLYHYQDSTAVLSKYNSATSELKFSFVDTQKWLIQDSLSLHSARVLPGNKDVSSAYAIEHRDNGDSITLVDFPNRLMKGISVRFAVKDCIYFWRSQRLVLRDSSLLIRIVDLRSGAMLDSIQCSSDSIDYNTDAENLVVMQANRIVKLNISSLTKSYCAYQFQNTSQLSLQLLDSSFVLLSTNDSNFNIFYWRSQTNNALQLLTAPRLANTAPESVSLQANGTALRIRYHSGLRVIVNLDSGTSYTIPHNYLFGNPWPTRLFLNGSIALVDPVLYSVGLNKIERRDDLHLEDFSGDYVPDSGVVVVGGTKPYIYSILRNSTRVIPWKDTTVSLRNFSADMSVALAVDRRKHWQLRSMISDSIIADFGEQYSVQTACLNHDGTRVAIFRAFTAELVEYRTDTKSWRVVGEYPGQNIERASYSEDEKYIIAENQVIDIASGTSYCDHQILRTPLRLRHTMSHDSLFFAENDQGYYVYDLNNRQYSSEKNTADFILINDRGDRFYSDSARGTWTIVSKDSTKKHVLNVPVPLSRSCTEDSFDWYYNGSGAVIAKTALGSVVIWYISDESSEVQEQAIDHSKLLVYPNPLNGDQLHIVSSEAIISVQVFDQLGKLLKRESIHAETLDMKDLPIGVYQLIIETRSGRYSRAVVVTR